MSAQWYYTKNGTRKGPFSSSELKDLAQGKMLLPTDLVWKEGMKEGRPASKLQGLFFDTPDNTRPSPSPPVTTNACAPQPASKTRVTRKTLVLGGVCGVTLMCVLAWLFLTSSQPATSSKPASSGKVVGGDKSVDELRDELMETAEQMEGAAAQAVLVWVDTKEKGGSSVPWSVLDKAFGPGKFTEETIAAYKRWRMAKIAEDSKAKPTIDVTHQVSDNPKPPQVSKSDKIAAGAKKKATIDHTQQRPDDLKPPQDSKDDSNWFDGSWKVVALEIDGTSIPASEMKGARWSFKGEEVQMAILGERPKFSAKLDSSKTPKQIDLVHLDGPRKGQTIQNIFKFENDRLVICGRSAAAQKKGRPMQFMTEANSDLMMTTLERSKE